MGDTIEGQAGMADAPFPQTPMASLDSDKSSFNQMLDQLEKGISLDENVYRDDASSDDSSDASSVASSDAPPPKTSMDSLDVGDQSTFERIINQLEGKDPLDEAILEGEHSCHGYPK